MTAAARTYGRPEMVNRDFGTSEEGGEDKAAAYAAELARLTPGNERPWYALQVDGVWRVVRDRPATPVKAVKR